MELVKFLIEKNKYNRLVKPNSKLTDNKLAHRELVENGIVILPNFFSQQEIEGFKASIPENLFEPTPEMQHSTSNLLADRFIPNANKIKGLELFFENEKINNLVRSYFSENAEQLRTFVRTKENTGPVSSFENFYHFDAFKNRVKVFLYLNEVTQEQAPVAYLKQSHKSGYWRFFEELDMFTMYKKNEKGYASDDISAYIGCYFPHKIEKLKRKLNFEEIICTGQAGTIIIFDAKGLHKATQLLRGKREILMSHWSIPNHHI